MKPSSQTTESQERINSTKAHDYAVTTNIPSSIAYSTNGARYQTTVIATTKSNPSKGPDTLFKVVAASAAVSAVVFIITTVCIVVCCFKNRRKRTAKVNVRTKEIRTGGKHGLTYSLKRTFSDGPLYAVTNLYTSKTFPELSNDRKKFRSRNYDEPDEYLTPVDGISPPQQCFDNGGYLQPMDGGRQLAPETSKPTTVAGIIEQRRAKNCEESGDAVKIDQSLYEEVTPTSK